jgi:glycosyltransferase involved in cell wall biosynthesis
VLSSLAPLGSLRIYGPGAGDEVSAPSHHTQLTVPPPPMPQWLRRYTWWRYLTGAYQHAADSRLGGWLASELAKDPFDRGYFFTQIAQESLTEARTRGARTILDNPTGHIRTFRETLCREAARWTGWPYLSHPNEAMVRRVEDEYRLADRIRVSSQWAKRSLVDRGIDEAKVFVVPQAVDLGRFVPVMRPRPKGPLRLVFVGSFSLGKGFQYLLRAMTRVGAAHVSLEMVGATGDVWCHRLLNRLKTGLDVIHVPGDPLAAYHRGELFVLPTLHDGFGLVVAEAMACGLPVLTTDACGAAEWITDGESGWVLPAGNEDSLATALDRALSHRDRLIDMGRAARRSVECLGDISGRRLQQCVRGQWQLQAPAI